MLSNIGFPELIVILVIALLLFGTRLPAVGKSLGEGIKAFKKGLDSGDESESKDQAPASKTASNQRVLAEDAKVERIDRDRVVDVEHKDVHKS